MSEYAKHEKDLIRAYENKGFDRSYHFRSNRLIDNISKETYPPENIRIVEEHRYEGMSNPDDLSILYVLEMKDGTKGTFLMAYGPDADVNMAEFFKAVPKDSSDN